MSEFNADAIIGRFEGRRVIVIGDLMLDRYLWGEVTRISPEAPVPVVHVKRETAAPGGAANAACNVAALGAHCTAIGIIGTDNAGDLLLSSMKEKGVDISKIIRLESVRTIEKTRVMGGAQQLTRVDFEEPLKGSEHNAAILDALRKAYPADAIILSDYTKGLLNPQLVSSILALGIRTIVDPKPASIGLYKGAFLVKPNADEAEKATGISCKDDAGVEKAGAALRDTLNANILLSRGKDGMSVFSTDGTVQHAPTLAKEVFDVTGAGDTVVATAAVALSAGASLYEAAVLANAAGGLKVAKVGTATVSAAELNDSVSKGHSKVKSWQDLKEVCDGLRRRGKRVVFTNGCFDILHPGHTRYLQKARALGDALILGLNSDASVQRLKGPTRPVVKEQDRAEVLASLACVDYVTIFDQDTPVELLKTIKPQVFAKGADWQGKDIPELPVIREWGGEAQFIPLVEGRSTTTIVQKIKAAEKR